MERRLDERVGGLVYDPANFRELGDGIVGKILWKWLRREDNVIRMETASYLERSAVEPLGPHLLQEFGDDVSEDRVKQMIGHMARQIMEALGYELVRKGTTISKGMFSTGARYQRPEEKRDRSMRITREQREAWLRKTAQTPFNIWLKSQVSEDDGRLNLQKLYRVAEKFGVTDIERYKDLNPGQQRMSIGNRLRSLVPQSEYDAAVSSSDGQPSA